MKEIKKEEEQEEKKDSQNVLKELFYKAIKTKIGRIISLSILIVILLLILLIIFRNPSEKVDSEILINTIKQSSELTTAEINYKGIAQFKDKGIIVLNRSDFLMQYTATARIGIDLEEVSIKANNLTKTVSITIPHAKVLDIKIDPSKIKYYDEAIEYIQSQVKEPLHLYLFSNDMNWVKNNFQTPLEKTYVEGFDDVTDMRLMSHCKHNIIANSSFSWWGAYLNQNPNKQVILAIIGNSQMQSKFFNAVKIIPVAIPAAIPSKIP